MNVRELLLRHDALMAEADQIEHDITELAGEWYGLASGRQHFHRLEMIGYDDDYIQFVTPTRNAYIDVDIPIDWFEAQPDAS